jgi:ABC-type dipeptide transport system, periplasmic component
LSWCSRRSSPYWRKIPSVKRLVFKVIPEETTRLAALKMGEVDIVYAINGELAKELRNTGANAQAGLPARPVLALFSRAMGRRIAVA